VQTRLEGLPFGQLPTPEQQLVLEVQGAPSPSAMQPGAVVDVDDDVEVVVGGAVLLVDDEVEVVVGGAVLLVDDVEEVVVGGTVLLVDDEEEVVVGGTVLLVDDEEEVVVGGAVVVVVVADVSLNAHSDQPIRSCPYWFQTGFLPPVMVGKSGALVPEPVPPKNPT
jgi:hypothetical protein